MQLPYRELSLINFSAHVGQISTFTKKFNRLIGLAIMQSAWIQTPDANQSVIKVIYRLFIKDKKPVGVICKISIVVNTRQAVQLHKLREQVKFSVYDAYSLTMRRGYFVWELTYSSRELPALLKLFCRPHITIISATKKICSRASYIC